PASERFARTTKTTPMKIYLKKFVSGQVTLIFTLACFALSPGAQAADGGLANGNTAEGKQALRSLTTGIGNTAMGFQALKFDTSGNQNTANGAQALLQNTADNNTANGFQALFSNTTGGDNTAIGVGGSIATQLVSKTLLLVIMRSLVTRLATSTRSAVFYG